MTEERAREILEEVLKEEEAKQEIIVKQIGVTPPTHNGVTSKTASFIESLKDETTMKKIVDELSDDVVKFIKSVQEDVVKCYD